MADKKENENSVLLTLIMLTSKIRSNFRGGEDTWEGRRKHLFFVERNILTIGNTLKIVESWECHSLRHGSNNLKRVTVKLECVWKSLKI